MEGVIEKKFRYSVLAFIINKYEIVHEIEEKDPDAEYLLITDDKTLTSDTWTVIYDSSLERLSIFDRCYAIRFNTFKYCHSDICVRLDANICIKKSLKPLIDVFETGGYDIGLMPHPLRNNFIEEYKVWVETRGYDAKQAERIIRNMRDKGYDFEYKGLFQTNFWIQRRNLVTDELNKRVFDYLIELGTDGKIERINQVPFSFVMNTCYSYLRVLPLSEQIVRSSYMQWHLHNSSIPNMNIFYDLMKKDIKYMFNKEVECMYFIPDDKESLLQRIKYLENAVWNEQVRGEQSNSTNRYLEGTKMKLVAKNRKHLLQLRIMAAFCFLLTILLMLSLVFW